MNQNKRHLKKNINNLESSNKVAYTAYKVENAFGKVHSSINISDNMKIIVEDEFRKIRKTLNL